MFMSISELFEFVFKNLFRYISCSYLYFGLYDLYTLKACHAALNLFFLDQLAKYSMILTPARTDVF